MAVSQGDPVRRNATGSPVVDGSPVVKSRPLGIGGVEAPLGTKCQKSGVPTKVMESCPVGHRLALSIGGADPDPAR
jgi:hypothetical protein